jgi:hypothetical protein
MFMLLMSLRCRYVDNSLHMSLMSLCHQCEPGLNFKHNGYLRFIIIQC